MKYSHNILYKKEYLLIRNLEQFPTGSSFDFKVDEPQNTLLAVYHLLKVMHSVLISNNGCIQVSNHLTPTVSVVNPYTSKFNLL